MAQDPPPLTLSDIMHPFTPSPPQEFVSEGPPSRAASPTPEPLDHAQIESIRSRLRELGITSLDTPDVSARERELAEMVFKLCDSCKLDPTQLVAQAEIIHQLTQQREVATKEVEEERARWEAERQGWSRIGEALLVRRRVDGESFKQEEFLRQISGLEGDNKSLRQRLFDTQSRLTSLESELIQLKPLLLLQPIALSGLSNVPQFTETKRASQRKKEPPKDGDIVMSDEDIDELAEAVELPNTPKQKPIKTIRSVKSSKGKGRATASLALHDKHTSLMSDARAEHLLLAARKFGRERVAYVSGMIANHGNDDGDEGASTSTPHTPRRASIRTNPNLGHPNSLVYVNSPAGASSSSTQILVPAAPATWSTPLSTSKSAQRGPRGSTAGAQTPLDSLVSAARSMLDDDRSPSRSPAKRTRRTIINETTDTPVPKRRRSSAGNPSEIGRVRSALDVLADQAAAQEKEDGAEQESEPLNEDEQSPPHSEKRKGKGRVGNLKTPRRRSTRTRTRSKKSVPEDAGSGSASPPPVLNRSRSISTSHSRSPPPPDAPLAPATTVPDRSRSASLHEEVPLTPHYSPHPPPPVQLYRQPVYTPHGPALPSPTKNYEHPVYASIPGPTINFNFPNATPGFTFLPSPVQSANADYLAQMQRGGARMTLDPYVNGGMGGGSGMATKKKKADDKRAKTPYKKWSKEEDEVLAQAVAKYGQKWDQVQKALPERGYHQVRQRWLRRLRSVDAARTALEAQATQAQIQSASGNGAATPSSLSPNSKGQLTGRGAPNPKLGMAPLSSELAVAAAVVSYPNPNHNTGSTPNPKPPPPHHDSNTNWSAGNPT